MQIGPKSNLQDKERLTRYLTRIIPTTLNLHNKLANQSGFTENVYLYEESTLHPGSQQLNFIEREIKDRLKFYNGIIT